MTIGSCRTIGYRNLSLSSPANHSIKMDVEYITISISSIIFALAFLGNTAALLVMFGKQGPVRLTNSKYLANLACADLLRACFMPFTIIARMKRNFMFGRMICKILPVVQGLSVAVDVFSLICITIERYLAICHPLLFLNLRSAQSYTFFNAVTLITIWTLGLLTALPNLHMYNLCSLPNLGRFKCEKTPLRMFDERVYMLALDAFYFLIPMLVMIVLYTSIIWEIYRNSTVKKMRAFQSKIPDQTRSITSPLPSVPFDECFSTQPTSSSRSAWTSRWNLKNVRRSLSRRTITRSRSTVSEEHFRATLQCDNSPLREQPDDCTHISDHPFVNRSLRKSLVSTSRANRHRRKTLKLLITLIIEFCICWTPLFIFHTLGTFDKNVYRSTSKVWLDVILLLSFASAACNPLTYYFLSKRYRSVLYAYLPCRSQQQTPQILTYQRGQQAMQFIKVSRSSQRNSFLHIHPIELRRVNLHRNSRLNSNDILRTFH